MGRGTAFDRYIRDRMKDPAFASAYRAARAEIDSVDALVRALDAARLMEGMSKAELARKINTAPEVLRRLFTAPSSNPTLDTVLKLAGAMGLRLQLVPRGRARERAAVAR